MTNPGSHYKPRKSVMAKRLTSIRETLGLTQKAAADKLRVNVRTWLAWERGTRKPSKQAQFMIDELEAGNL